MTDLAAYAEGYAADAQDAWVRRGRRLVRVVCDRCGNREVAHVYASEQGPVYAAGFSLPRPADAPDHKAQMRADPDGFGRSPGRIRAVSFWQIVLVDRDPGAVYLTGVGDFYVTPEGETDNLPAMVVERPGALWAPMARCEKHGDLAPSLTELNAAAKRDGGTGHPQTVRAR